MRRATWRRLMFAPAVGLLLCCAGCNIIGAAAQVLPHADIAPAYDGLAHQTVGVMVWLDRGVAIDYPSLQADVARSITNKLSETTNQKDQKKVPKEVAGTQYLDPMTVIRFQADHPELEGTPSTDVAPRLGVSRVIYVEIYGFETRSEASIDLFKGTVMARLEVLEVTRGADGKKTAKVAYADPNLRSVYPPRRPEGIAGTDVSQEHMYRKTSEAFAEDVSLKFLQHPEP